MTGPLSMVLLVATLAGCVGLAAIMLVLFSQLLLYLRLRQAGMTQEGLRLARALPAEGELPHVVVQIPVFNERAAVQRSVQNAIGLEWPREKLHVQVCDDSTDDTTELARAAAAEAAARGFDVAVLHRSQRAGFKAGALQAGMEATGHEYFLILDVDFVSPPDFLRHCMTVLLSEPDTGFVQARVDFWNRGESALTRAQSLILDWHYGLEVPLLSWAGKGIPFMGTCGVWRRAAIEAAGGWRGEALLEDWDLSYRARLKGWNGTALRSVAASGELPAELGAWTRQQQRWATGRGQVALTMLPKLLRGRGMSSVERWGAIEPLALGLGHATFAGTFLLALVTALLRPSVASELGLLLLLTCSGSAMAVFAITLCANRALVRGTPIMRFLADFVPALALLLYVSWASLRSLPDTVLARERVFIRTPKRGSVPERE